MISAHIAVPFYRRNLLKAVKYSYFKTVFCTALGSPNPSKIIITPRYYFNKNLLIYKTLWFLRPSLFFHND